MAAGPIPGPTDPRRVQSAFRAKCECVRAYMCARMHAWTDKATGTRSKDVRLALLLEIHRDSRAVCGRPAAKREKGAGARKSAGSLIRDMREIEIVRNGYDTVGSFWWDWVSCEKIGRSLLVIVVHLFDSTLFPLDRQKARTLARSCHWIFGEIFKTSSVHSAIDWIESIWIESMLYILHKLTSDSRIVNKKHKRIFKR